MKKYILATIIVLSTVFAGFAYSAGVYGLDRGISIEMHQFNERGDSLHISYTVHLDSRAISRFRGMSLTPALTDGNRIVFLPSFVVVGPNKERVLTRYYHNHRLDMPDFDVNWRTDNSVTYSVVIPFQMWMENAQLVIHREVQKTRARSIFDYFALGNRVELEPRPMHQLQPRVEVIIPAQVEREPERTLLIRPGQAFLDFPVGQSNIQPNFRRNPVELARAQDAVRTVITNADAQLQSIYIRGFASPEGTAASNYRLSAARAIAFQNHLHHMFNIPLHMFRVSAGGEDWDGLVGQLNEDINVHIPDRERILNIIATEHNLDRREQQIRALHGNAWSIMLRELFPDLRRVNYYINYTIVADQGLRERNVADMSHHDLFQTAEQYGRGSDQAFIILTSVAMQRFPDDELAHNNAAALHMQRGDLTMARVHLERAGNGSAALNNRGVLAMLEGNLERAEDYLTRAQVAGSEDAEHNRNELRLKREDIEREERRRNR